MHLHMWGHNNRRKGAGLEFIKMSLPHYFQKFRLKILYCEPYALNPAPNKTLEKTGFEFIKTYDTTPGWINFHQPTNRWCMDHNRYTSLFGAKNSLGY
jgi:RimJ/RimL family protein N-acetyltransferase